jgi:outer membrane protein TolC
MALRAARPEPAARARRQRRAWLIAAALAALAPASTDARADTPAPPASSRGRTYGLPEILTMAERNHPTIAVGRAKIAAVRAQLDEAHTAPFSQFRATGGVTLAPGLRGSNVFSPNTDVSLTSSLGVAWRANVEGVVPLWTFGKITNLWEAAEANVAVNEASLEKDRDDVRYDVRKAYFGLQLARDTAALLRDVRAAIQKGVDRLNEHADDEDANPTDLLKLQTYSAELAARESEVQRYERVALAGLRFYTGAPELDIPDRPLALPRHQLGHVTRYLTAARLYRPEVQMARAGIVARKAQVEMARAGLFPDFGLGLSTGLTAAPEIADQLSPYVEDPGNYFHYGAALVFQWKLDFLPQAARIRFAEAQLEEVRSLERFALGGVGADVERAYEEAQDRKRQVDAYEKAVTYAKRWLITVQHGIDIGTVEDKELLEPAKTYATQKFSLLNAILEYDLAVAGLAKATGWDAIAPDGA